jgi:hypothetical protein
MSKERVVVLSDPLGGVPDADRPRRIEELMGRMDSWGVARLVSALDFYEGGVLDREEAISVCGVDEKVFSEELALRRRERREGYRRR